MVVEDRKRDPRFRYVDELEDIGIEWYAGTPIITEEGYHVGSFCIADTEKKQLSESDRRLMKLFAEEAMEKSNLNSTLKSVLLKG